MHTHVRIHTLACTHSSASLAATGNTKYSSSSLLGSRSVPWLGEDLSVPPHKLACLALSSVGSCQNQSVILFSATWISDQFPFSKLIEHHQSFQVEGPQNREISLFIGNTIGRFLSGTFQGGKTASNSCYLVYYINKT